MNNNLNPELLQKISLITENYIKSFPQEWAALKKQNKAIRENLLNKNGMVKGTSIELREIMQIPETLHTLLLIGLSTGEFLEYSEKEYKRWFGNKYPDLKVVEGRL